MDQLLTNVVRTLRYLAPPVVALVVIWLVDPDHDVIIAIGQTGVGQKSLVWTDLASWWPVGGLAIGAGVFVYHVHRAVAHPLLDKVMVRIHRRKMGIEMGTATSEDLDFARWCRRGMGIGTTAGATQAVLDEANAAAHFLYCTGWCIFLLSLVVTLAFRPYFDARDHLLALGLVGIAFVALGAIDDYGTTKRDIRAFLRYPGAR
jgi:hypothetical protein